MLYCAVLVNTISCALFLFQIYPPTLKVKHYHFSKYIQKTIDPSRKAHMFRAYVVPH